MAMLVSGWTGIWPRLYCVESGSPSTRFRARGFALQRAKLGGKRWRVACAGGEGYAWRRDCCGLREEMHALQGALADAWLQDEMRLLELEKLVSALVAMYAPMPSDQAGDGEVSAIASQEEEADSNTEPELEGADELYKDAVIVSELRSEELRTKQEALSTLRRLKPLNVHEYVHSALQASHLRSWLKSRGVAE